MERVAGREIDAEQSPRRGVVVRDTAATVDDHDAVVQFREHPVAGHGSNSKRSYSSMA